MTAKPEESIALYRDAQGRAFTYETAERAERDVAKLRRAGTWALVAWVPMPRRPWRVWVRA